MNDCLLGQNLKYDLILTILWSKYGVGIISPILQMVGLRLSFHEKLKVAQSTNRNYSQRLWVVLFTQQTLGFYHVSGTELGSGGGWGWVVHWGLRLTPAKSSGSKASNPWAPGRSVSSTLLLNLGMQMQTCFPACFWRVVPPSFSWALPSEKINSEKGWWELVHWWDCFCALYTSSLYSCKGDDGFRLWYHWPQFPFL